MFFLHNRPGVCLKNQGGDKRLAERTNGTQPAIDLIDITRLLAIIFANKGEELYFSAKRWCR